MAAIVVSFIAAAALVILVKDDLELNKNPLFWFCLAIFGYTFCTYFIVSFITNPIYREKLWWIHNVANISAYLMYAYGYWVSTQRNASK
jgi:amino acid transporter